MAKHEWENTELELWLRTLPGLYFHSTEETKAALLNGETDVDGAEHLKTMLSLDEKDIKNIYESDIKSLTMLKKLGIVPETDVEIRPVRFTDLEAVKVLDELSGNSVFDMTDDEEAGVNEQDYTWGAFLNGELIGYCTLGGAEEFEDEFDIYKDEDLCLGDVFIKGEYRGKGYGTELVIKSIATKTTHGESVFATILDDDVLHFYESLGFVLIHRGGGVIYKHNTSGKA